MAKLLLSTLIFIAAIESARVARVCEDEELSKFKIDIFEKLTSLAASVLEFTNSKDSEKQQVQNVLDELALRHKLEVFKSLKKTGFSNERSNTELNDEMEGIEEVVENTSSSSSDVTSLSDVTEHSSVVTTPSSDVTSLTPDATPQNSDAQNTETESSSQSTQSQTESTSAPTTETISKQCRQFGDECSPKLLEFCCEEFTCVRKNKLSPRGRCRYKF